MGSEHNKGGDYTTNLHCMGILGPLQGSHLYKLVPVSSNIIKVLNVAQITPVLIVIQMTHKQRHIDLVGVRFFFATFPPNSGKSSIFLFSWPLKFGTPPQFAPWIRSRDSQHLDPMI